ncbi:hypothetical protein D3C81_2268450 [compost metagenome]
MTKLPAKPMKKVAADHRISAAAYSTRGDTRSTSQPPGICMAAYVQPKADRIRPSCQVSRPNSSLRAGAAMDRLLRSR